MGEEVRVGILGAGANTRERHIPGLLAQRGVRVVAVCNRTLESSQRVCDAFGIARACASPHEVLDADDVDAIVIGTWPYKHAEFTLAALERGKHVLCEARMAMNAAEAERMLAASRARPTLVAQVVPSPFSLPFDEAFRAIVGERLGALRSVRMELIAADDGQETPARTWRRNRAFSGNNVMAVGIWYEALMRWVGPVGSLSARLAVHRPIGIDPQTRERVTIDVPDHVEAVGEMARGGLFSLTASSASGLAAGDRITITGSGGTLAYDGKAATFTPAGAEPEAIAPDPARGWRVEEEFIRAIRGEEGITLTDFDTGVAYMRFTDALHDSDRAGRAVRVTG